ncbi:hypothetical protein H6768_07225 [Candidatus Peribacteria bacterium]|nr:hypothetical protein [Candidatus Peribacteria bacterium]
MNFLVGLLVIGLGVVILKYIRPTYEFVGSWVWAEKFFGIGGTVTALKLLGIVFIVFGAIYALGWV